MGSVRIDQRITCWPSAMRMKPNRYMTLTGTWWSILLTKFYPSMKVVGSYAATFDPMNWVASTICEDISY
ncbi:hypothetical protein DP57_6090 [Burkholderia pseudomallei]|nr:hypothetical protein DP57_6090 [Burkholderia pseudomallei]